MDSINPPHSDDAERAVLGAIMRDPRTLSTARRILETNAFWRDSHRIIWRALCELDDAGKGAQIDTITVADALMARGQLDKAGGDQYIKNSIDYDASGGINYLERADRLVRPDLAHGRTSSIEFYCEIVARYARQRAFISTASAAAQRAALLPITADVDEFFADSAREIARATSQLRSSNYVTFGDALAGWFDDYGELESGGAPCGMSSGLDEVDDLLGGFHAGRSIMIAGLSKMGKTKFTAQVVLGLAINNDVAVDWYTVEMPPKSMARRAVSLKSGLSETVLANPQKHGADKNLAHQRALIRALADLNSLGESIRFYTDAKPRLKDILLNTDARLAELQGSKPLIVVVDYIQRVDAGHSGSNMEYMNTTDASQQLTGAAIEKGFLGLYVSHFSRSGAKRRGLPKPSDARGSGAIEQDCDHFLVVHRPFWESDDELMQQFTVVWQALNRHGATGCRYLQAQLELNKFYRWTHAIPEYRSGDDD